MAGPMNQIVSLFSGAGGLSQGFALAGCKPTAGVEINKDARQSYQENLGVPCFNLDLSSATPSHLRRELGIVGPPLAIVGGPPCQGFSSAGARSADDPRNRLIFNYLHIVEELSPRWFLFENVEGLLTANGGMSIYELALRFVRLGYVFRIEKVNFAGFGLPQARKRVVIVGNKLGLDFRFPAYTRSFDAGKHRSDFGLPPSPTLAEALAGLAVPAESASQRSTYSSDLPQNDYDAAMRRGNVSRTFEHHFFTPLSKQELERIAGLRPGQTMKDLPENLWHDSYRRRAFRRVMDGTPSERRGGAPSGLKRLRADLNSLTITGSATQEFVHPTANRTLTLRECARLQSFHDTYRFSGGPRSVAQQIGNAVPPIAAQLLGELILSLDGLLGSGKVVRIHPKRSGLLGFHLTSGTGMSPALAKTHSLLASVMGELTNVTQEEMNFAAR
jgi:DNA (cytosine-5)-methyltransferase 1